MTDSSPGSKYPGTKPPLAPKPSSYEASRNVSTDNSTQPSSILMSEDHFGSGSTRPTTSHPLDGPSPSCFVCQNGKYQLYHTYVHLTFVKFSERMCFSTFCLVIPDIL